MQDKTQFKIDHKLAREIAESISEQYKAGKGPYEKCKAPNYNLPQGMIAGSKEHALYLTYIFALETDTDPSFLWKKATILYRDLPWFFDAYQILTRSNEGLFQTLEKLGVANIDTAISKWRTISKILIEDYSGDPRKLTEKNLDQDKTKKMIARLLGNDSERLIRKYLQLMTVNKLLMPKNPLDLEVFVDRNITIYTIYTGVLKFEGDLFEGFLDKEPITSLTSKAWNQASAEANIPSWELDDSLYLISSKLCSKKKCILCPIREKCEKRFTLEINGTKIRLSTMKPIEPYIINFCINCGRELVKDTRFCDHCGIEIIMAETD